ncbi:MAG: hypothetical protein QHJ34_12100 [bacterium]|nr:hypothetical protein [bacterium]
MRLAQTSLWRNYLPTIVLLFVLLALFIGLLPSDKLRSENLPTLNVGHGSFLVVIGLLAGLLGGLIGTGGCSVMFCQPFISGWVI